MRKSLSSLYLSAYQSVANKQHAKYGNPTAEQYPAPTHVPGVLEQAERDGQLNKHQTRILARVLGRKAYGEVGLTHGVVSSAVEEVLGCAVMPWYVKAQLVAKLEGNT